MTEKKRSWEAWTGGIFIALCLGLFAADLLVDFSTVKLAGFFVIFFWIPLLVLHEAGHALAALLLGWRIRRVVIGFGRNLVTFSLGSTAVEVRAIPLEGFVRTVPGGLEYARLKNAFIYFAGPGAEIALVALLFGLVGWHDMTSPSDRVGIIAAQSCSISVAMGLLFNLVPHAVETSRGPAPNDGLGVVWSFFLKREHFSEAMEDDEE